jgi:hypothetical protein
MRYGMKCVCRNDAGKEGCRVREWPLRGDGVCLLALGPPLASFVGCGLGSQVIKLGCTLQLNWAVSLGQARLVGLPSNQNHCRDNFHR